MNTAFWLPLLGLVLLTGCFSDPPQHLFLLTPPARAGAEMGGVDRGPALELRTVTIPDYLDTTDIVFRGEHNEIHVSNTGRWAERLSIGVAAALRGGLTGRLRDAQIVRSNPSGPRLFIDIETFEFQAGGRLVLIARWNIPTAPRQSGNATIVTQTSIMNGAVTDEVIVTAMTNAIGQLADRIANGLVWPPTDARSHHEHPALD